MDKKYGVYICTGCGIGDGLNIEGVTGLRLEGADPPLTHDDVRIALRQNILGRHEEFVDGGHHAALEQHGAVGLA